MSIISRRQKELLLNDVYRMINNNNRTAFANQAKISESVSNGDLKFFIDSPKKEFVIRYGKKEIRFSCSDQNIKELNAIMFNDKSTIKGISDSSLIPSSNIALSTKWGSEMKTDINNKADKDHNHDDKYATKDHNHDTKYANINHTHPGYQPSGDYATKTDLTNYVKNSTLTENYTNNTNLEQNYVKNSTLTENYTNNTDLELNYATKLDLQSYQPAGNYASATHNHDTKYANINHNHDKDYADKDHTHWDMPSNRDDFEEEIKTIVNGSKAWRVIKAIFSGIEVASDVVQYGLIAGMQAQIAAIYNALAASGIVDAAQTTSTLGTALLGYSSKLQDVGNFVTKIGKSFDSVSSVCKKVAEPINKASEAVGRYSRIVDNLSDCGSLTDMTEAVRRFQNGADIATSRLPRVTDVLDMNLLG